MHEVELFAGLLTLVVLLALLATGCAGSRTPWRSCSAASSSGWRRSRQTCGSIPS